MAEHQPKRARQSENVHSPDNQQQDGNNEPPNNATEPKAITNIYYDCLERIFDFLDLEDLLNVARTCKRLQVAAAAKFGDDFGGKEVNMFVGDFNKNDGIYSGSNVIRVYGLKFCLPFLRCFGAKVLNLITTDVRFLFSSSFCASSDHFGEYINQYCADTLISINFHGMCIDEFWAQNSPKPFKKVEKVVVRGGFKDLSHFVDLFPKLRHLKLSSSHRNTRLAVSFPYLEHLKILGSYPLNGNCFDMLRANRQLKSVSIKCSSFDEDLLNGLKENTSISKLKLHVPSKPVKEVDMIRFASEHPLLAELKLVVIAAKHAMVFIRHLESVKRFEIKLKDRSECDRLLEQLDPKWKHNVTQNAYSPFKVILTC